jgi:hypothetical protein
VGHGNAVPLRFLARTDRRPTTWVRDDVPPNSIEVGRTAHDMLVIIALPDPFPRRSAKRIDAFRDFGLVGAQDRGQRAGHRVSEPAGSGGYCGVATPEDSVDVIGHHDECVQHHVRVEAGNLKPALRRDTPGRAQAHASVHYFPERGDAVVCANRHEICARAIVVPAQANRSASTNHAWKESAHGHGPEGYAGSRRRGNRTNSSRTVFARHGQAQFVYGHGRGTALPCPFNRTMGVAGGGTALPCPYATTRPHYNPSFGGRGGAGTK